MSYSCVQQVCGGDTKNAISSLDPPMAVGPAALQWFPVVFRVLHRGGERRELIQRGRALNLAAPFGTYQRVCVAPCPLGRRHLAAAQPPESKALLSDHCARHRSDPILRMRRGRVIEESRILEKH
ncbi:uncharacterized protein VTP21DRAFT_1849 [Calcarisporiella thermophila]|uniref:uncharacterized protein n=1 Tax=Calcarisporiella thermophila TaxID=911321 RepID=UPI0037440FE6